MNQSTWMVPLNLHHSFVLKTAADNSRHLQNISASIYNLSKSVSSIQHSAADIAGSANAIVELLESTDHRNSTMAAMRALILSHQQTCTTARDEEDAFTAYASCVISERLLNQSWFNMELFSHASFEEMAAANEMMKESMEAMGEVRSRLPPEESRIVETLPQIIDRIEELSEYISDREHRLFNIIEGHWVWFPVGGRVCVSPVA